nr:hypothetical protein [uncultured Flavobacterium sp.]
MKFNINETQVISNILNKKLEDDNSKTDTNQIIYLINQLNKQEYIKGRLLKVLYNEIIEELANNSENTNEIKNLASKIKFKVTPR